MSYDLVLTAVSERADLFAESLGSLLDHVDMPPARVIVHEDVKPGSRPGSIAEHLDTVQSRGLDCVLLTRDPAAGLGPAVHRLLHEARTPIVFKAEEDWTILRPLPVAAALGLMQRYVLNSIAFGKRTTPAAKHPGQPDEWRKEERLFDGQPLALAQFWRSQGSLWRVEAIRPFFDRLVREDPEPDRWAMVKVNRAFNLVALGDVHGNDHAARHAKARTYLWGGVGEPAFIAHTGAARRAEAQSIERYGATT